MAKKTISEKQKDPPLRYQAEGPSFVVRRIMDESTLKKLNDIENQIEVGNRATNLTRASSVSVGTAFGGTCEITMRGRDGSYLWCNLQPVEVIELIHQLAANAGCHIHIKPRDDFASWRNWKSQQELTSNHAIGLDPERSVGNGQVDPKLNLINNIGGVKIAREELQEKTKE